MSVPPLLPAAAAGPATRRVHIGGVVIGGDGVPVIAGPCSVERDHVAQAEAVAQTGAAALRACVWKPRTRPTAFQGLGEEGLVLVDRARRLTGLPAIAEPLEPAHVELLIGRVDALLIGARSMQNTPLLRAAGRSGLPVILKRGLAATYDEWLGAAEYVLAEGNPDVILCERGMRTHETATRSTLDIAAIPVLRERSGGLPIIVDPSHAAGNSNWVIPLALGAVAAGADGLLVEAHPIPDESWSDADQALSMAQLRSLVEAVELLAATTRRTSTATIDGCRAGIDAVDAAVARLLERRAGLVGHVQRHKRRQALTVRDLKREDEIVGRMVTRAPSLGRPGAAAVVRTVVEVCLAVAGREGEQREAGAEELVGVSAER
jgi:3-deoxy-7-phosphoheptulonate synthase